MKVFLEPQFKGEDTKGDGGIRRVVEAQVKYLPTYGVEIVSDKDQSDLVAVHAATFVATDRPYVTHCHGLYWKDFDWPGWARRVNMDVGHNLKRANEVTVPSNWVAESIRYAFWRDPVVIGHGIDPEEFVPQEDQGYVLWNKTRVDKVCTIEPLEELAKRLPQQTFVSTFGQGHNILNVGRQSYQKAKETLSRAGVYLSTAKETFGIGTLEAMAFGIPVLGWRWGGTAEIVRHELDGYLAEPGDYDDLVRGLEFCISKREILGAEARAHVLSKWVWEKIIGEYADLYRRVTASSSPGVSVVIPCYNLGRFLNQAVESVVREADEVIICDDASTDDSRAIMQSLAAKHNKVRAFHHDTNQHVATTLNDLIMVSRYDYIVPLDADNYMPAGAVTALREALDSNADIDIAYGAMQCVGPDGEPLEKHGPNGVSSWPPQFKYTGPHTYPRSYCSSTSMYRRAVWERTGGYRPRYKGVEDADFWTRATSLGFLARRVTEAVTFCYRIRDDSLSHTEPVVDWTQWYPKTPPAFSTVMRDRPEVSIVIPVGPGHEVLVQDAVDSIWNQTFEKWECIVIDDSEEGLIDLPPWVRIVRSNARGPARARNLGIVSARGKYIYFLDADDYLQPKCLEELLKVADEKSYVYSDWVDHEGTTFVVPDCACKELATRCPIPINILYPRSASVMFDENLDRWEDWDFLIYLEKSGISGVRVNKPLFRYRLDKGLRRRSTDNVDEIKQKWGEINLACGACGQRRPVLNEPLTVPTDGSWVLMDYTNTQQGTRSYRAPSGQTYRFGTDSSHRTKYVRQEDVSFLLSLGVFKLHEDLVPA